MKKLVIAIVLLAASTVQAGWYTPAPVFSNPTDDYNYQMQQMEQERRIREMEARQQEIERQQEQMRYEQMRQRERMYQDQINSGWGSGLLGR